MKKIIFSLILFSFALSGCSYNPPVYSTEEYDLINVYQFYADYPVQRRGINYHFQYIGNDGILRDVSINSNSDFLTVSSGDVNKVSFKYQILSNGIKSKYVDVELILTEDTIKSFD